MTVKRKNDKTNSSPCARTPKARQRRGRGVRAREQPIARRLLYFGLNGGFPAHLRYGRPRRPSVLFGHMHHSRKLATLKVSTERIPESQVLMTIEVESERLHPAREKALRKLSPRARVPGFRPGKAPA